MQYEIAVTITVRQLNGYNSEKVFHSESQRLGEEERLENDIQEAVSDVHSEIDRQALRRRKREREKARAEEM